MTDSQDGSVIAFAKQHFFMGGPLGWSPLSNWSVDVKTQDPLVPTWVIGFMAALDDIESEQ